MSNPFDDGIEEIFRRLVTDGRTQADFARALGVSQKHISMIFTNQADPSLSLLRRMWAEVSR